MIIKYVLLSELPFVYNIDDSYYKVCLNSENYQIYLTNKCYAGTNGILGDKAIDPYLNIADINTLNKIKGLTSFIKLKTVIYWEYMNDISVDDVEVSEQDILNYYKRKIIIDSKDFTMLQNKQYIQEIETKYTTLSDETKQILKQKTKEFIAIRNNFPDEKLFLQIINKFTQCYMLSFKSIFVEEVTLKQLGYSVLNGVIKNAYDENNNQIDAFTHIHKIPDFIRTPWYQFSEDEKNVFSSMLLSSEINQIELLICRAKSLFDHGIFRSAIIEANAAMEFSVQKRIYDTMVSTGVSPEATEKYLRDHQEFKFRCNEIFLEKIGFSLMRKDNTLWQAVVENRKSIRNIVAHSNKELKETETKNAIDCFIAFAKLAQK